MEQLSTVGDAYAKPIVAALDREPCRWDISSLVMVTTSGVMCSEHTKEGLLRHHPSLLIADVYGYSEAVAGGVTVSRAGDAAPTARFRVAGRTRVLTHDGGDVQPGSGEVGVVAIGGFQPTGYDKDRAMSAVTFRVIDGRRHSVPGDYATEEPDGTITVLGPGSVCVNSGGEKIFPEEVEEALNLHVAVADAVVVGVPDDQFGEVVVPLVEPAPGATAGKVDYRAMRAEATSRLLPDLSMT